MTDPDYDVPCDMACDSYKDAIEPRMHFPTAKRFMGATLVEQAHAIKRETDEMLIEAHSLGTFGEDIEALAEETWDNIHASETQLAMLEAIGVDVWAARDRVEQKNRDRGYYEAVAS